MNVTRCLHLAALVALATGMAGAAGSPGSAAAGPDDPPHAYRQPAGPSDLLGSFGRRIGDLDPHFGLVPSMPGRFTVDFGGTSPSAEFPIGVLMLPGDGFIVVGISTVFEPDDGARLVLSWHRRDGHYAPRLDQGREIIPLGNLPFEEFELLRAQGVFDPSAGITQPRVYAAGRATSGPGNSDFLVICVTYMTGSFIRCPGFGSNGMATVPFDLGGEPYRHDRAGDLHIDVARQRLLLAGSAQFDRHDHDFAIASLDMNSGAPDPTFGNQGRKTIPFDVGGLHGDHAHSILVHMDGRISVGGSASDGVHPRAAMAQLLPDGSLDTGFCPTAEPTCDSPLPYRNGRRLWNDEPQGQARGSCGCWAVRSTPPVAWRWCATRSSPGRAGMCGRGRVWSPSSAATAAAARAPWPCSRKGMACGSRMPSWTHASSWPATSCCRTSVFSSRPPALFPGPSTP